MVVVCRKPASDSPPGTAIYGGSTDIARNVIAERHLGLPRSTPRRSKQ